LIAFAAVRIDDIILAVEAEGTKGFFWIPSEFSRESVGLLAKSIINIKEFKKIKP
jgi:hypothetical protein